MITTAKSGHTVHEQSGQGNNLHLGIYVFFLFHMRCKGTTFF